jgi:hypothetical protein
MEKEDKKMLCAESLRDSQDVVKELTARQKFLLARKRRRILVVYRIGEKRELAI